MHEHVVLLHPHHRRRCPPVHAATVVRPTAPSSPSLSRYGEPLSTQSVPIESLGAGLAPQQNRPRPLTVSQPESAGEPPASKGEEASPILALRPKGFVGWAMLHSGQALMHSVVF
jgi:hypothetical protein